MTSIQVPGLFSQTRILLGMKARLIINSLIAGKSNWTVLLGIIMGSVWFIGVWFGALDLVSSLGQLAFGAGMVFLLALFLGYMILTVFLSDLFMGHTMNVGQMNTDLTYLSTLPLNPLSLLFIKLTERMLTDWPGIIILLSSFCGVALRKGWNLHSLTIGLSLYFELEMLIGLSVILLVIFLQRFLRTSTLSNAFSLLTYLLGGIGFIPVVFLSSNFRNAIFYILQFKMEYGEWLDYALSPLSWLIEALLRVEFGPPFWKWNLFWLSCMTLGNAIFLMMVHSKWMGFVHAGLKAKVTRGKRFLIGMYRKETLLLKSDFNLLTNALFLPLTVIVIEIFVLKDVIQVSSLRGGMNAVAFAALYFCMFGPINSIGSEGKAIFFLETLPMSPEEMLRKKTIFWAVIAEFFFIPSAILIGYFLTLPLSEIILMVIWMFILVIGFVWVTISFSAIFPNFEAKILQKSSAFEGKFFAALVMSVAIPAKGAGFISIQSGIVFILLGLALRFKAAEYLKSRLDQDHLFTPEFKAHDAFLIVFIIGSVHTFFAAAGGAISDSSEVAMLVWFFARFVSLLILGRTTWKYAQRRFPSVLNSLGFKNPGIATLLGGAIIAVLLAFAAGKYLHWVDSSGGKVFSDTFQFWSGFSEILGREWALVFIFLLFCVAAPLIEEAFFRGFFDQSLCRYGLTGAGGVLVNGFFFAINHPPVSMPLVFVLGMICTCLYRFSGSIWPSILTHAIYNAGIISIYYMAF